MSEEWSRAITRQVLRKLTQDTEPWLSCDDCFDMLDGYVDRRMADPDDVDVAMATHLEACPACAEEAESLLTLLAKGE
jgi:hypothetical protein